MSNDNMCYEENENKYESKCKEGCYFFFFFCFLRPCLQYMVVSRLGVEFELQLPAYTTATTM